MLFTVHVDTKNQIADMLNADKALADEKFRKLRISIV